MKPETLIFNLGSFVSLSLCFLVSMFFSFYVLGYPMSIKTHLFILFTITLLSLGVWLMILFNIDPSKADFLTTAAFFASLFLWLMGILTFVNFYLRIQITNKEVVYSHLPVALRHSILLSLLVVGLLVFRTIRVITWWDAGMFIVVILLIELFFRTRLVK